MPIVKWLLDRKVEYVGYMYNKIAGPINANKWLLDRKVEYVGYMYNKIAGSMNANS